MFQRKFGRPPLERFKLTFDFTEPPLFTAYNPSSQQTPNRSGFEIIGASTTWFAGVEQAISAFATHRKRYRSWLHSPVAHGAATWLLALPTCFWLIYRFDCWIKALTKPWQPVIRDSAYIYLFLLLFLVCRIAFWAVRWLFPLVELKGARSASTRAFLTVFVFGGPAAVLFDFIRWLFV